MHCLWPRQCENISAKASMALKPRIFSPANLSPSTVVYTHTSIHTYTHTHTYMHTHIHTYKHRYVHTYIHIHTHTYTHTYVYTYINTYIHTHMHTYIRTFVNIISAVHNERSEGEYPTSLVWSNALHKIMIQQPLITIGIKRFDLQHESKRV